MRATEQILPAMQGMDTWQGDRFLSAMLGSERQALDAVERALVDIADAAEAVAAHLSSGGGRIIYAGAGCSGMIAAQDQMELWQTFSWPETRSLVLVAGGEAARLRNAGPGEDDPAAARDAALETAITDKDVVIVLAASGSTPWTLALAEAAKGQNALVIAIANNPNVPLLALGSHAICLDTGAEVVAGSTRLSATTAQKVTLNMLSTLVMTRMGHVMDGMMINFVADNDKLRQRAAGIVAQITGSSASDALHALEESNGRVKVAVLVMSGLRVGQAEEMLAEHQDNLRAVLNRLSVTESRFGN